MKQNAVKFSYDIEGNILYIILWEYEGFPCFRPIYVEELHIDVWYYPPKNSPKTLSYVLSLQDIENHKQFGFLSKQQMLFWYIKDLLNKIIITITQCVL